MAQDLHQRCKERYADAQDALREQHARMLDDMRFSNPAEPQQWDDAVKQARAGRPCLTFDRTNQFIMQVVNDARQAKPAIKVLPADSRADVEVAKKLNGMIRHIEYVSRAGIAYDTAVEHIARVGLGWLRVVPEVMRPETNEQEIRIKRLHDPFSASLDPNATDPTGADAGWGFVETTMTHKAWQAAYPKCKPVSMDGKWATQDGVKLCEMFEVVEKEDNRIVLASGEMLAEDDFWTRHKGGEKLDYSGTTSVTTRSVKWRKLNGEEIIEETDFPSQYLPLIQVIGYELWLEGKRYLCGMVRRLRDGQMAYNYERSAFIEAVAMQPKAPFIAPFEAVEEFEDDWRRANTSNAATLFYNHKDEGGDVIPAPQRQMPPPFPVAFTQGGQIAVSDMEAAVGMYKSNLGQQSNSVSGRAKREDKEAGDVANYHYIDNTNRSLEQLGRVIVDMIPRVYDTARQARILGEDGSHSFVQLDPGIEGAAKKDPAGKVQAINVAVGAYDVRVDTGPSYTTMRQEAAQNLIDLSQGNPQLAQAMAPMLMKLRDMPEGEKAYKVALALLPPPVQQAYQDEAQEQIPPQVAAQMQSMQQQMEQMQQTLMAAQQQLEEKESEKQIKLYEAETKRITAMQAGMTAEQVQALVIQTMQQVLSSPPPQVNDFGPEPPGPHMEPEPPQMQTPNEPPQGGFFVPGSQPAPDLPQVNGMPQ